VQIHENTEFTYHVRLVLESNTKLEKQVGNVFACQCKIQNEKEKFWST